MRPSRDSCSLALIDLLKTATKFVTVGRKFTDWDQITAAQRPALFLWERGETIAYQNEVGQVVTMHDDAIICLDPSPEPTRDPISDIDALLDELDRVLAPTTGMDQAMGRQTLGGLVYHCRIQGEIVKASGDVSNISLLIVPINVMIAQRTV